jgi:hypothetical protein
MKINGLHHPGQRNQRGYLDGMPLAVQFRASEWLSHLMKRHPHCPGRLLPIMVGQAKRLARMSEEEHSSWGRSTHAKRGGYAVQRALRVERPNRADHPRP